MFHSSGRAAIREESEQTIEFTAFTIGAKDYPPEPLGRWIRLRRIFGETVKGHQAAVPPGFSQPRQCGDDVFLMLVTGGPPPIHSVGVEVDRDAVVIAHLDQRLAEAASRVIDLMAMTRMARVAFELAGSSEAV